MGSFPNTPFGDHRSYIFISLTFYSLYIVRRQSQFYLFANKWLQTRQTKAKYQYKEPLLQSKVTDQTCVKFLAFSSKNKWSTYLNKWKPEKREKCQVLLVYSQRSPQCLHAHPSGEPTCVWLCSLSMIIAARRRVHREANVTSGMLVAFLLKLAAMQNHF